VTVVEVRGHTVGEGDAVREGAAVVVTATGGANTVDGGWSAEPA